MIWALLAKDWIVARALKLGVIGVGCVAVIGGCMVRDARLKETGRQEVVQASQKAGAEANAKNDKVRAAARQPGAADRLRRESCRDC